MTIRVEQLADGVAVHLGDCLEILPTLGPKFANQVIADCPYEHHMHERRTKVHRTDGYDALAAIPFASIDGIRQQAADAMVKASSGWLLIFCAAEGVAPWRDAIEAAEARYKRACAWVKPDSAPQFNGQGPAHGFENIVAAWCGPGLSQWNGGGRRGVFTHLTNPQSREGSHPTEKPLSLMGELVILFTNHSDVICDPFMGSGSTGVAAVAHGRKFVGIEKDARWFDLACRRIGSALKQSDFFAEVPKAKQLPLFEQLPKQKRPKKAEGAA